MNNSKQHLNAVSKIIISNKKIINKVAINKNELKEKCEEIQWQYYPKLF